METVDISNTALLFAYLLLLVPIAVSYFLKLNLIKNIFISVFRMSTQLFIMAIILEYLFTWDIKLLNIIWLMFMIGFAAFSVVRESNLKLKKFIIPVFSSMILANIVVLLYFNYFILSLGDVLQARHFVVIGGMLLGNALRGNIIGIGSFYKSIERNKNRYLFALGNGASIYEAIFPYFKDSFTQAIKPTVASMATIGVVFLPGMMTGQILGGSDPSTAIKYQIAIMLAIFLSVTLSVLFTILLTVKSSFDSYGVLNKDIFK